MINASTPVYLRENAVLEPLVNGWYASSYLLPPLTAALYLANHHLKVMESFVATPQVHVEAVKNPAMLGGPFIALPATRVREVAALLEKTKRDQAPLLELAAAAKTLDDLLQAEGTGGSLDSLYAKVPAPLRGLVELVYDRHHRPYFRAIEALFYQDRLYQTGNQSLALSLRQDDQRSFALSTPRLEDEGGLRLQVPFASAAVDELARARHSPTTLGLLADILRTDVQALAPYFTEQAPGQQEDAFVGRVRVRYFGHACLLVQSKRVSVLVDPLIPYKVPQGIDRKGFSDLPESIDYVVLTHNHQDHVLFETLLQLRHRIKTLVVPSNNAGNAADPSLKLLFRQLGFANVVALDDMESLPIEGGSITALPFLGEHGDLDVRSKAAHLIKLEGRSVLGAADSNNLEPELYRRVHEVVGSVDLVFLGMECQGAPMSWLYGPLLGKPIVRKHDQTRRLDGSNCDKALDVIGRLRPTRAFIYAMGAEPWLQFITSISYTDESKPIVESNRFIEECRQIGVPAERLYGWRDIVLE